MIKKTDLSVLTIYVVILHEWLSGIPNNAFYNRIRTITLAVIVGLFVVNIFLYKNKAKWTLLLLLALLILTIYSYTLSTVIWPLYLIFLTYFSTKIPTDKLIAQIYILLRFILIASVFLFVFRFVFFRSSVIVVTSRNIIRYCISFASPATAAEYLIMFVLVSLIYHNGEVSRNIMVLHFALAIIFYILTRSEMLLLIPISYIMIYFDKRHKYKRTLKTLYLWLLPVLTVISGVSMTLVDSPIITGINQLLSGRFILNRRVFMTYGITALGQSVNLPRWISNGNGTYDFLCIDNTLISFMVNYGFIYLIPLLIFPFLCRNQTTAIMKIVWCIYSALLFSANASISPLFIFPFMIMASQAFCEKTEGKKRIVVNSDAR